MNIKFTKLLSLSLASMFIVGCFGGSSSSSSASSSTSTTLTSITIVGASDVEVEFDASFNLFTGVTATGNNGEDFTDEIVLQSTSSAVNITTGDLDTTRTGLHAVRYTVTVGSVTKQQWRNVTVGQPTSTGMLINPDFALGTAGWDDPSVVYNADGSAMTLSTEDGALKAEVTAGANAYTPRFGQMNVPFEQDTTYQVSFDAKSSVEKAINLNVGELLTSAPWFVDFKPMQPEIRTLTTEWATYSYKFTHTLDNKRGGLLFELGKVNGQQINATVWFDNIAVEVSTPDEDTSAPVFSGVLPTVNVTVGSTYDPLAGVTAYDLVDGDVTADIVVVIKDDSQAVVESVDTSVAGTYTVEYSVSDSAENLAEETTAVNVVDLLFKDENLIENGSFETEISEEWGYWQQDWGTAPVVNRSQNTEAGTYSLDIAGGGDAAWAIQFYQENIALVEGQTYRLSITGYASVERSISVALGYGNWVEYGRKNGLSLTSTSSTSEYIFTVTQVDYSVRVVLELGSQDGFVNGMVTLEEVRLQRLDTDPIIANGDFSLSGWRGFANTWEGTAFSAGVTNGEFAMTVTAQNTSASWHLQIVQDAESLAGIPGASAFLDLAPSSSYVLTFDAYATKEMTLTPNIFSQNIWSNYVQNPATTLTTTKTTYTLSVDTPENLNDTEKLAFEFGTGLVIDGEPQTVYLDNVSLTVGGEAVPTLYNGDMETALGGHTVWSDVGATLTTNDEGAVITASSIGGVPYNPHYYYTVPSLDAGTYNVKFVISSSVARTLRFNIVLPNAGFASILEENYIDFSVNAEGETVVEASFDVATPLTDVKVEIDFGTLGGDAISEPGTFTLHSILLYRNYNAQ